MLHITDTYYSSRDLISDQGSRRTSRTSSAMICSPHSLAKNLSPLVTASQTSSPLLSQNKQLAPTASYVSLMPCSSPLDTRGTHIPQSSRASHTPVVAATTRSSLVSRASRSPLLLIAAMNRSLRRSSCVTPIDNNLSQSCEVSITSVLHQSLHLSNQLSCMVCFVRNAITTVQSLWGHLLSVHIWFNI